MQEKNEGAGRWHLHDRAKDAVVSGQPPIHGKDDGASGRDRPARAAVMDMSAGWKDFNETKDFP
jgi:hypothetical protein